MKRHLKKAFIPPFAPIMLLVVIYLLAFISENSKPVGDIDDSARGASFFMILLTPIFYGLFTGANVIDYLFDLRLPRLRWLATFGMMGCMAVVLGFIFYSPSVDDSPNIAIMSGIFIPLLTILPMSIWRRSCWWSKPDPKNFDEFDLKRKPSLN